MQAPEPPLMQRMTEAATGVATRPWAQFFTWMALTFRGETTGAREYWGTGSPQTVVAAAIGSTYRRTDGGASTTFYVKEADDGLATGWVAK